jgi:Domain of Unknown Function (DUF1206)
MAMRTRMRPGYRARSQGRRAANSRPMKYLARTGLVARGVMYAVIGWIALQIAFGKTHQLADRTGALHQLSGTPFGAAALWLLVVGFFGMTLWRLSEALYGVPGSAGHAASSRLQSLARAVIYAVIGYGVLTYALGAGAPQSTNQQSVDLTATLLRHNGGQAVAVIIGLGVIAVGLYLGYQYWRREFLKDLMLGQMRARTRRVVERLGQVGGVARGIVFVTAGIFLVVAAAKAQPREAKGIDSSLRVLAGTPLGPWLLVAVAIGLIMFGVYSCCEARWRRV